VAHPSEPDIDLVTFEQVQQILTETDFASADELLAAVGHDHREGPSGERSTPQAQAIEPGGSRLPRRR
jgi:hypothetical protein